MPAKSDALGYTEAVVLNALPLAMGMLNEALAFVKVNDRFIQLFQVSDSKAESLRLEDILGNHMDRLREELKSNTHQDFFEWELDVDINDQRAVWLHVRLSPVLEKGKINGWCALFEDVSPRRELRRQRIRAQFAMDQSADAISVQSEDASFLYVNDSYARLWGIPREEFDQLKVYDLDKNVTPTFWKQHWASLNERPQYRTERSITRPNGERVDLEVHRSYRNVSGEGVIVSIARDVTLQKAARREMEFKSFCLNTSADAVAWTDAESNFVYVNDSYARMVGYSVDELLGMRVLDVDVTMNPERWRAHWTELKTKRSMRFESKLAARNGGVTQVELSLNYREFDGAGYNFAFIRDITERNRTLRALEKTQFSLDHSAEPINWTNANGEFLYANEAYLRMMGYSWEELQSMQVPDINAEMRQGGWEAHWKELKSKKNILKNAEVRTKDGRIIQIELSLNYREFDGQEINFAFIRDISRRVEIENQLKESEALFRTMFEGSPMGMGMSNAKQEIILVNREIARMFGYSNKEFTELTVNDLLAAESLSTQRNQYQRIAHGGETLQAEMKYRKKDGQTFWGRRKGMRVLNEDGTLKYTMGIIEDITNERKARKELAKRERNFRVLFEENPVAIAVSDFKGNLTNANSAFRNLLGYSHEELLGMDISEFALPEDQESLMRLRHEILEKEIVREQRKVPTKNGDTIDVQTTVALIKDDSGEPVSMIGMVEDLTEKRKSQMLRRRQTELESSNRELEQFVHVASHDLREPLRSIRSLGDMLLQSNAERIDEHGRKCLDFIIQASTRMDTLVRGLLEYSRLGSHREAEMMDLGVLLSEISDDLQVSIREANAEIRVDKLPRVKGYRNELRLLFQNLISNAVKFRDPDRTPHVEVSCVEQQMQWEFCVKDNGIGIPLNKRDEVFFIFRRLHAAEDFEGSGIGLAHSKRVAEIHGGTIWVESEPGQGSCFKFTLSKLL